MATREQTILRTSYAGIGVNLALVAMKMTVGWLTNSVAIVLDAVNNATDAISSVITIIGTKLANRPADRNHPYGHGRVEYLSAAIIGAIIAYAGITAFIEAVDKILHPSEVSYTIITMILIGVGVGVKFFFGHWVKNVGTRVKSGSLIASGEDAIMDSVLSTTTLVAALLNFFLGWQIEGYLGAIIAIMILRTAWEVLTEATASITGARADSVVSRQVRDTINQFDGVQGTYDLNLHDYGPDQVIATAHIQVADTMDAKHIHELTHRISDAVYKQYGFILTLGIYAANDRGQAGEIKKALTAILTDFPAVLQMHGYYFDETAGRVYFDLIIDWREKQPSAIKNRIITRLREQFPDYQYSVVLDTDVTEEEDSEPEK